MDFIWNKIQFTITDLGGGKLGEKIPMHAHAKGCYELHFVTEGKGTLIADGNKIELKKNDFFITGPNIRHSQNYDEQNPIEDVFILIQVKNDKSKNVFSSIFTQHNFCYLENVDNQFAKMLLNEWKNKNPDYESVISGLMIIILTQITRLLLPKDFQEFANKENLNDKRFAIIEQAFLYENDITLTKLSQMIGLCDRQTQRLLKKYYGKKKIVKAVDDVSLEIHAGSSMALIGESGSGKTTFGKLIAGLEKPTDGKFWFQGQEMQDLSEKQFRPYRKNLQMVFQSSSGVFDPGYTIGENILEILKLHEKLQEGEYEERVKEALIQTGLDPDIRNRYVGQISGGQCQRANIARALVLRPELVICDEPVSSLDYSIRKQILHLLNELQEKYEMTYLLITHDLSNVPYLCKEVAIMYQGRVVEFIDHTDSLKETAVHPYTKDLFDSIPVKEPKMRRIGSQEKKIFSDTIPEQGCPYQNRCRRCTNICREHIPELTEIETGHFAACHMLYK